jgi:hypothetical protein
MIHERVAYRHIYARLLVAMSMGEALEVLGFPPGADPSPSEVKKQQRRKTVEHHPDRGGDAAKQIEVNVAADILLGKQRPSGGFGGGYERPQRQQRPYEAPKKQDDNVVTFDEAKASGGVPGSVEWMFVTTSHSSGYSSDEMVRQATGWVAVGQTDDSYIFTAVENYRFEDYFPGSLTGKHDVWRIKTIKWGKSKAAGKKLTSVLVGGIKLAWGQFQEMDKKFNYKVIPAKGWTFGERMPKGRATTVKNYVLDEGLMREEDLGSPRTYTIEVNYETARLDQRDNPPAGYYKHSEWSDPYKLTIIVNGTKDYPLSENAMAKLHKLRLKGKSFLEWMFGDYYYGGETKNLTRKREGKQVMAWMAENLPVPEPLRTALVAAATKKPSSGGGYGGGRGRRRRRYG